MSTINQQEQVKTPLHTHNQSNINGGLHPTEAAVGNNYRNVGNTTTGSGISHGRGFHHYRRGSLRPSALGMIAFATILMLFSLVTVHARRTFEQNILVGPTIALGSAMLLAAIYEGVLGNTYNFTTMAIFAAFWWSYGLLLWPSSSGTASSASAFGLFYISWFLATLVVFAASFRRTMSHAVFYLLWALSLLLLASGSWRVSEHVILAGGWFGIFTSVVGYYIALSELLTQDYGFMDFPTGNLGVKEDL